MDYKVILLFQEFNILVYNKPQKYCFLPHLISDLILHQTNLVLFSVVPSVHYESTSSHKSDGRLSLISL